MNGDLQDWVSWIARVEQHLTDSEPHRATVEQRLGSLMKRVTALERRNPDSDDHEQLQQAQQGVEARIMDLEDATRRLAAQADSSIEARVEKLESKGLEEREIDEELARMDDVSRIDAELEVLAQKICKMEKHLFELRGVVGLAGKHNLATNAHRYAAFDRCSAGPSPRFQPTTALPVRSSPSNPIAQNCGPSSALGPRIQKPKVPRCQAVASSAESVLSRPQSAQGARCVTSKWLPYPSTVEPNA
eukprot:TRINITY_DN89939_c0_g1_i1.p1 TRINITY_DN89939_c0_g1~~TRINITY_DN89939_c0_g1_i1.p1  ORF type:complete len:246 (-),score=46.07 TRINITY_DN89939_c0_g1_i1:131-868(-)